MPAKGRRASVQDVLVRSFSPFSFASSYFESDIALAPSLQRTSRCSRRSSKLSQLPELIMTPTPTRRSVSTILFPRIVLDATLIARLGDACSPR